MITLQEILSQIYAGQRLDAVLAKLYPDYSRVIWQNWIKSGAVLLDGKSAKPNYKIRGGENLTVQAEEPSAEIPWHPENLSLDIVYEDDDILVLNKPIGIVVHPAAGHWQGTLVNALLHHCPALTHIPRAGIVHRLDKNTSGLLVIAKTLAAHHHLTQQLKKRTIKRDYLAIVNGKLLSSGSIDAPIGRDPRQRKKMAVVKMGGKAAMTHYRVLERFQAHTEVLVSLETGRTHQIRVHFAHIRHPLVGDSAYGGRLRLPKAASPALIDVLQHFRHQALHATHLALMHPRQDGLVAFNAKPPRAFKQLLQILKKDAKK